MTVSQKIPLSLLEPGKMVTIRKLDGGIEFQKKLSSLNIRVGKTIFIVTLLPFNGPVVIQIGNTKVSIGRGMAQHIIVEKEQ